MKSSACGRGVDKSPVSGERPKPRFHPLIPPLLYPQPFHTDGHMARIHLHLLSDSTGETLENIAKAAIGLVSMDGAHIHDIVYRNITAVRSTPLASERPAHTCERMTAVKTILCADQHGHPALFLHWGAESTAAHA